MSKLYRSDCTRCELANSDKVCGIYEAKISDEVHHRIRYSEETKLMKQTFGGLPALVRAFWANLNALNGCGLFINQGKSQPSRERVYQETTLGYWMLILRKVTYLRTAERRITTVEVSHCLGEAKDKLWRGAFYIKTRREENNVSWKLARTHSKI